MTLFTDDDRKKKKNQEKREKKTQSNEASFIQVNAVRLTHMGSRVAQWLERRTHD